MLSGDRDLVDLVDLLDPDEDPLLVRCRHVLADEVRADRKLAVSTIDEDGELDASGPAVVEEGVDRGPGGAAREEDVVDEDDRAPGGLEVQVRRVDDRLGAGVAARDVVAVEGDVQVAERDFGAGELPDQRVEAASKGRAAGVDADEGERVATWILLDDLVRDTYERAAQIVAVEDDPVFHFRAPSWPLWTWLKEPTAPA